MPDDRNGSELSVIEAQSSEIRVALIKFVRELRQAGVKVPASGSITAGKVITELGLDSRTQLRAGLKAAIVTQAEDIDSFNLLFERFWQELQEAIDTDGQSNLKDSSIGNSDIQMNISGKENNSDGLNDSTDSPDQFEGQMEQTGIETPESGQNTRDAAVYSASGMSKSFQTVLNKQTDAIRPAVRQLSETLASLPGRRIKSESIGRRPDVRTAFRESISSGGLLLSVPEAGPTPTEFDAVVLTDVSRSVLNILDREFLVRFLWNLTDFCQDCRIYFFDQEIQEVTDPFDTSSINTAMTALRGAETSWGGGTRIGNAVTSLRERAPPAVDRESVVLIISDGLEMGDISQLESGIAWLSNRAQSVFWFNPLACSGEYEPTAAGMATALPYIDGLFGFSEPADVLEIVRQLQQYNGEGLMTTNRS